jgi:hypothetical protein
VTHRAHQRLCVITAVVIGFVSVLDAQRRVPGQAQSKQAITASLKVGGQPYESREPGRCTYAPTASIYSIVSEMWSVQQSTDGRSLTLTLWKPKDGSADMVTLAVTAGNSSQQITTVRGGSTSGSGKVTLAKSDAGGVFTVDAKTGGGAVISGTITCDAFAPHIAEGGL